MTDRETRRRINYDLCTAIDVTKLGLALDRLIASGLSCAAAHQYRAMGLALLTLLRCENDRLAASPEAKPPATTRDEPPGLVQAVYGPFPMPQFTKRKAMTTTNDRIWGPLPDIDPDPNAPMCGEVNGKIICCRSRGHEGRHATPFPSFRRHGPVWIYWGGPPLGPFGTCHEGDPATHLYCGLEKGHEGDHLSPSNQGPGATLAEWSAAPAPPADEET